MRLRDDPAFASVSKAVASFSKQTVCNLHKAQINKPKNFIRARFIFPARISCKAEINWVLLHSTFETLCIHSNLLIVSHKDTNSQSLFQIKIQLFSLKFKQLIKKTNISIQRKTNEKSIVIRHCLSYIDNFCGNKKEIHLSDGFLWKSPPFFLFY